MKTALIKTSIWDDDVFYDMNIDTKLIYLLLLTSPERGVGRIFKMSDRLISARSGLNLTQILTCKKQLSEIGLVYSFNGWIMLTQDSSFIQPVRGRLTKQVLLKEIKDIPENIINGFSELTDINDYILFRNGTGTIHELDNDNDKDDDNDNDYDYVNDKDGARRYKNMRNNLML